MPRALKPRGRGAAVLAVLTGPALALALLPAAATEIKLYDGTLGTLPPAQGWLTYQPVLFSPTPTVVSGQGLRLNTGVNGAPPPWLGAVGFTSHLAVPPLATAVFNPAWPVLDSGIGVTLSFELQVFDEDHTDTNRAGFSAILLGADHQGIELGFWEDSIWAQSGPSFTHGESVTFNTRDQAVLYGLTILGSNYWLSADGVDILSGAVRDYSPATPTPDPYGVANFVFLGDDTGSAAADFFLGDIGLRIPTPPVYALLAAALPLVRRRPGGRGGRSSA